MEIVEPGRLRLIGALNLVTVPPLLAQGHLVLNTDPPVVEIDLAPVTQSDSAGLVLLLDWLRTTRRQGRSLRYLQAPSTLRALARISGIDGLLFPQDPAGGG